MFNGTASTEIYTYCHTPSLHDALPIWQRLDIETGQALVHKTGVRAGIDKDPSPPAGIEDHGVPLPYVAHRHHPSPRRPVGTGQWHHHDQDRTEEHTSELQSLMRISYAVLCLTKKNQ